MESWATIILTLILLIVPAIVKSRNEKIRKGTAEPLPKWVEDAAEIMARNASEPEEEPEEELTDAGYYDEEPELVETVPEPVAKPAYVEGVSASARIPAVDTEHFVVEHLKKESKIVIDPKQLIVYSEIMKPKFQEF